MTNTQIVPPRLLRLREVLELVGVSDETLQLWVRKGLFPRPLEIGPRARAWRQDEINVWIQTRGRPTYKADGGQHEQQP